MSRPGSLAAWAVVLSLPLVGFVLLLAVPALDVRWEHQPSHFWLVLGAAGVTGVLAYSTSDAARRRADARVYLVSLGFLTSSGFLFLHALATPGVLLEGPNAGFVVATPVGLTLTALLMAASVLHPPSHPARAMRRLSLLRVALLLVVAAWAVVSVAELPPLDGPPPLEQGSLSMVTLATVALLGFGAAAVGYSRIYLLRPSRLVASVVAGCVLLGQAMVAVAFSRSWHVSWWEWHVLMLVAFAVVASSARAEWREERFAALYGPQTSAGRREVSVLFADLEGFTPFSESREPEEVSEMLNAVFRVAVPAVVEEHGGEVDQIAGDAIMVTFNARGDQPDHALRAARAALGLRKAGESLGSERPEWPRMRMGINTGEAVVGVLGTAGGRTYTVVGDVVNVAARLQQTAPSGGVAIGAGTLYELPGAKVSPLGRLKVKGRTEPVEAYSLHGLDE